MLMTAIAIGTAPPIERFRQNAIETGSENLQNTVRLLATHFDRQFEDSAALQNSIIAELEVDGIGSAEVFRSEMATLEIHEALRESASGGSDVAGADVFDNNGLLINSSKRWSVADVQDVRPAWMAGNR